MRTEQEVKDKVEELEEHKYEDDAPYDAIAGMIDALEWVLGNIRDL